MLHFKGYDVVMARAITLENRRKRLPRTLVQAVHLEAGFQCARPQCRMMLVLDCHHIWWVKDGGGNDLSNLICLCPNCHTLYHRKVFNDEAIRHWKALLVAMNHAFDRKSMDMLLTINQYPFIQYSGGELLHISSLIQAKLVELRDVNATSAGAVVTGTYRVETTERGKLLIEAWNSGESDKYHALLMSNPNGDSQA